MRNICIYILFAILAASCTTPKNIAYFQDAEHVQRMLLQPEQQFRLRPEDKINIIVNSSDPMLASQFTLTVSGQASLVGGASTTTLGSNLGGSVMIAYTVDDQGDITFPILGKIPVAGKTRLELEQYIADRLIDRKLVMDPIVTVSYVNMGVNVLGEVNRPGRIDISKDHFTILDALAQAGDLTINGERERVLVSRNVDGEDRTYVVNLCSKHDVMLSPAYYLQQNDVVYVAPNTKRIRESNSTINVVSNPTFWISAVSLFSTLAVVFFK